MVRGIHELGLCCKLSTSLFVWNQSAVCRTCKSDPCVALSAHLKVTTTLHGAADKPKVHTTVVVTSTSKENRWKNNFGYGTLNNLVTCKQLIVTSMCLVLHWCMYCCNHVHLGTIRINPINTHHHRRYLQRCGQADFWHAWSLAPHYWVMLSSLPEMAPEFQHMLSS